MDFQDNKLAAFERMSQFIVSKHIQDRKLNSYDYLGGMINNMQQINTMLMKAAINVIKKLKDNSEVNTEYMTVEFRKIIYGSVERYVQHV